jgi:hypothetical protein
LTRWVRLSPPKWALSPPSLFDIVTGFYPETRPKDGTPAHRPCLVTAVLLNSQTGQYACRIAYGTKNLKTATRADKDLIISKSSHLDEMGLPIVTRFALDEDLIATFPWDEPHFRPWTGYKTPKIGALTLEYQKDYAWIMAKRAAV